MDQDRIITNLRARIDLFPLLNRVFKTLHGLWCISKTRGFEA